MKIKKFFKDKKNQIAFPKKLYEILNSFSDFLDLDQTLNVALSENDYEIGTISYINYGYNLDLDKSRDILLKRRNIFLILRKN